MGVGAVWACDISRERYRATRGRCSAGSEKWIDVQVFGRPKALRDDDGSTAAKTGAEAAAAAVAAAARRRRGQEEGGPSSGSGAETEEEKERDDSKRYDSAGTLACLRAAKEAGYRVVVASAGPSAIRAEDLDWESRPTAFVVGNEAKGVSEEARAESDAEIMVPMVGMVESLNVSVASACIMQAALGRIRQRGGDRWKLDEREEEVEALTAAMLLRHKGQQGKVGALWQAPMMRAILARTGGGGGGGEGTQQQGTQQQRGTLSR